MAIIDSIPGIVVTVEIGRRPLKEWQDTFEAEAEREVVRYVEAVCGKNFSIKVKVTEDFVFEHNSITLRLMIDGNHAKTFTLWSPGSHTFDTMRVESALHKYRFSKLEIAAAEDDQESEALVNRRLGQIQVIMYHTEKIDEPVQPSSTPNGRNSGKGRRKILSDHGAISEKAIKGRSISHGVSFGPARHLPASKLERESTDGRQWYVKYHSRKAATFTFHYRSIDALKSMLIVPRTPSPEPVEPRIVSAAEQTTEDAARVRSQNVGAQILRPTSPLPLEERDSLTQEEVKELQRQMRAVKKSRSGLKRKHEDDGAHTVPCPIAKKRRNGSETSSTSWAIMKIFGGLRRAIWRSER